MARWGTPTCALEDKVGDVRENFLRVGRHGPTTIRPNEPLQPLVERMHRRGFRTIVVSDLKGQLVAILYREDAERAVETAREHGGS